MHQEAQIRPGQFFESGRRFLKEKHLVAAAALYAPGANVQNPPPLNGPNRSCVYCRATFPEPRSH